MNKPHLVDWTNAGLSAMVLAVMGWIVTELTQVKIGVAEMTGKIEYETKLIKDLNEEYQSLDEKVDEHENRLVVIEKVLELN